MDLKKCDKCKNWAFGCEINGDTRRDCIRNNFKYFELKQDIQTTGIITIE